MTIEGDRVAFDYRGSDAAPVGPFGFPRASLETAVFDGTLHCFPRLAPLNHGLSRAIEVLSTPGSCVDIREPTPASGYASGAYEKVAAVTMACWAAAFQDVDPRRMYAAGINLANLCIGGVHPKTGKHYVNYLWNEGGQGARSYKDGNPFQMMIFIGGATNQPVEILERWYPLLYTNCEGVTDSCGDGTYRGGVGIDRSFKTLGAMTMTMHGDRAEVTPFASLAAPMAAPTPSVSAARPRRRRRKSSACTPWASASSRRPARLPLQRRRRLRRPARPRPGLGAGGYRAGLDFAREGQAGLWRGARRGQRRGRSILYRRGRDRRTPGGARRDSGATRLRSRRGTPARPEVESAGSRDAARTKPCACGRRAVTRAGR